MFHLHPSSPSHPISPSLHSTSSASISTQFQCHTCDDNDEAILTCTYIPAVVHHLRGGQRLRYKDVVKRHLKAKHITVDHWETLAKDRQQWRQATHTGKSHIEEKIQQKYQHDHNLRHGLPDPSAPVIFCVNCGRGFKSQIGLFSHQRAKHVTDEPLH